MQDWESILRRGFESKELDYKGACAWDERDKKASCEIVKDILALANTKGGFLVFGVSESATGLSWDGLTTVQCASFETSRLNRFVQNYTDPPINAHVINHASGGSNFVIVEVPRFADTPHICQKDFPGVLSAGTLYVRTDNNESAPIKKSSDMRSIVEQAVRNRGDQLLSSFRAILTDTGLPAAGPTDLEQFGAQIQQARARCNSFIPPELQGLGFRESVFHPSAFRRHRFTVPDLEQMAEEASISYRGWPFIFYSDRRADCIAHLDDGLEMLLSHDDAFQFWRLHQSGCLYACEMFQEDGRGDARDQRVLGTVTTAYTCAEAVQCLVDLFKDRVAEDESVRLYMRLLGVEGRTLAMVRGSSYFPTPYQCDIDQIVFDQQHPLADWRGGVIPHAIDLLTEIHRKFHAPTPSHGEVAPLMQRLLSREL